MKKNTDSALRERERDSTSTSTTTPTVSSSSTPSSAVECSSPPTTSDSKIDSSSSSLWPGFFSSIFQSHTTGCGVVDSSSSSSENKQQAAAELNTTTASSNTNTSSSRRRRNNNNNNNNVSVSVSHSSWTWKSAVKRLLSSGGTGTGSGSGIMRRFQERLLLGVGVTKTGINYSSSDIWFLGLCYHLSSSPSPSPPPPLVDHHGDGNNNNNNNNSTNNNNNNNDDDDDASIIGNNGGGGGGVAAFEQDFSSRILMTYRKGFNAIPDSKYTSDVNWGCMLRSSQMLLAQALLCHQLGRSWRKPLHKPMDREYIEILHLFGDNEASPFSIHNLIQAGKAYGLAAGSWVGPYAMCRSLETLVRSRTLESDLDAYSLPMAVYIVSGDEDGERGGAPLVCIEDASRHCVEFSKGQLSWTPILLLVPLVLGLDKVNPRYIPLLGATFTFPQSLGILGGKPGASTYIVGVQDEKAFYLDPHEVQPVVDINRSNLEADTSSYHCNVVRHIPLDLIDPSLAIGFYCRDKDDFDDFCTRASKLADQSNGAPLFTVAKTHKLPKPVNHNDMLGDSATLQEDESYDVVPTSNSEGNGNEDDWQLL